MLFTVSMNPANGGTVSSSGPVTVTASVTDNVNVPPHTDLFQPQGNDWHNGSGVAIGLSVNGTTIGQFDGITGLTCIYFSDYGATNNPFIFSGYTVSDGLRGNSSGTLTFAPTTPWPANATIVVRIFLTGRDQTNGQTNAYNGPAEFPGWTLTVAPNITVTNLASSEIAAFNGDYPFLVGNNVIENYAALPAWSQGFATWASYTDVTDPNLPTRLLFDRQSVVQSGPVLAAVNTYTLLMSVNLSHLTDGMHSFDTFCLLNHNLGTCAASGCLISLGLADTTNFVTNLVNPIFNLAVTNNGRVLVTNLNSNYSRYSGITYVRLFVVSTDGSNFTAAHVIGELIMGRRRQLSYFPDVPFEDKGSMSDTVDHVARSGTRTRYVRNYGARRIDWTLRSAGADKNGLVQENEVRAWWRECKWGTQPSLVVQHPHTSPMPLYMFPDQPMLEMPIYGPYERAFKMTLDEQPTYWQTEQAAMDVYPV